MRGDKYGERLTRYYAAAKTKTFTAEDAYDERVWHAIHGATMSKIGDEQAAVAAADETVRLLRLGRKNETEKLNQERERLQYERRRRRRSFFKRTLTWIAALTVTVLAGAGVTKLIVDMERNDYAGMDQKFVNDLARDELVDWYGEERLGEHKVIVAKQRGHYYEQSAWKVTFRLPESQGIVKKTACLYLWDGSNGSDGYFHEVAVREGVSC